MNDTAIGRVLANRSALNEASQTTAYTREKDPQAGLRGPVASPTNITSSTATPSLNSAQGATGPPDNASATEGKRKKRQRPLPDGADPIVREAECEKLSGLSRVTRWRLERSGKFPRRIRLSENAVGWRLSAIEQWLAEREAG